MPFDASSAQLVSQPNQPKSSDNGESNSEFDVDSAELVSNPPSSSIGEDSIPQQSDYNGGELPKQSDLDKSSPLNPIQSGAVGLVNNPANIPQALKSTGVDPNRITLGDNGETLVDGIDINKTGLNNLNDVAGGVARGLTSNLPLLSQVGGDVAAGMLAPETAGASLGVLAAFNSATSMTGEVVRQLASKAISGENFNAGSMATQGAIGAASPYIGKVLDTAYIGTKVALLNTLNKVASKDGVDGLVAMSNHLVSNLNPDTTKAAIDKIRNGDTRILDDDYANEQKFQDNVQSRIFGEDGNLPKNIQKTFGGSQSGESAARELYSSALGILPEEDVNTILKQGTSIQRMSRPGALTALGENIANSANTLLDVNGKNLRAAQSSLLNKARGVQTDLTDINTKLAQKLEQIGFLTKTSTIDGKIGYSMNPKFDVTSTGSAQKNIFGDLVDRFFTKSDAAKYINTGVKSNASAESIAKALKYKSAKEAWEENINKKGGQEIIRNLKEVGFLPSETRPNVLSRGPVYVPNNQMNYGDLYNRLKNINVQISGNEFDRVGELSPDLTEFLKGLRGKTSEVAQKVGNKSVPYFNAKYGEIADTLAPVLKAARDKDGLSMENYMKSIANKSSEKQLLNGADINNMLKKEGLNMFDDLDAYRASQSLSKLDSPIVKSQISKKFSDTLEGAYNDNPKVGIYNAIKQSVDSGLPKSKQFSDLAETHILAKALGKDTTNIFKAGFLAHGLDIGGLLGFATGGIGGAAIGGVGGTAVGLALQKPVVRKMLIQMAAKNKGIVNTGFQSIRNSRVGRLGGSAILRELLANRSK